MRREYPADPILLGTGRSGIRRGAPAYYATGVELVLFADEACTVPLNARGLDGTSVVTKTTVVGAKLTPFLGADGSSARVYGRATTEAGTFVLGLDPVPVTAAMIEQAEGLLDDVEAGVTAAGDAATVAVGARDTALGARDTAVQAKVDAQAARDAASLSAGAAAGSAATATQKAADAETARAAAVAARDASVAASVTPIDSGNWSGNIDLSAASWAGPSYRVRTLTAAAAVTALPAAPSDQTKSVVIDVVTKQAPAGTGPFLLTLTALAARFPGGVDPSSLMPQTAGGELHWSLVWAGAALGWRCVIRGVYP